MNNRAFLQIFWMAFLVTGCATLPPIGGSVPVDAGSSTTSVRIQGYTKDGLDLPMGAYRIAGTSYVVLRQTYGTAPGVVLLGPIGILAAHSAEQEKGKAATDQYLSAFKFDLDLETKSALKNKLKGSGKFQLVDAPKQEAELLDVTPYVWVGTYSNGQSRVHVILRAQIKNKNGEEKWWNQYIYYSDQIRPLTGDNGWITDDGASIKSVSRQGIEITTTMLVNDLRGTLKHVGQKARYKAPYMEFPDPIALEGTLLSQDKNVTLIENRIGWAGLHILPTQEVSIAPSN